MMRNETIDLPFSTNRYEDPGFWTNPREGKYIPRFFSQPEFEQEPENHGTGGGGAAGAGAGAGAGPAAPSQHVGRIRVYFFEVHSGWVCGQESERERGGDGGVEHAVQHIIYSYYVF